MPRLVPVLLVLSACAPVSGGGPRPAAEGSGAAARSPDAAPVGAAATQALSTHLQTFYLEQGEQIGCDLDGDGQRELVSATAGYGVELYEAVGGVLPASPDQVVPSTSTVVVFLSCGGDLDGDGWDDLVVAEPGWSWGTWDAGVRVYAGGPSGVADTPMLTLTGPQSFGYGVSSDLDVDQDGVHDLIVHVQPYDQPHHLLVVYRGGPELSTTPFQEIDTGSTAALLPVAAAGDQDGDGWADLLVGRPDEAMPRLELWATTPAGLDPTPLRTLTGRPSLGRTVGAGDFDGDGVPELVATSADGLLVYAGGASAPGVPLSESADPSTSGWEGNVGLVGDLDGDGAPELAAVDVAGTSLYVWASGPSGYPLAPSRHLAPTDPETTFHSPFGLGDLDGDGAGELAVVARDRAPAGKSVQVFSGVPDADRDGWAAEWDCEDHDDAVLPWHCGHAADLVVDGGTTTLGGAQSYRAVWVVGGGRLSVPPYRGGEGGWLGLEAELVYVEEGASVRADGAGSPGGGAGASAAGAGGGGGDRMGVGGGGGHGGRGGDGLLGCTSRSGAGGARVGSGEVSDLELGGGGGGGRGGVGYAPTGGRGGGAIGLYADELLLYGTLRADGAAPAGSGTVTGGAGAGGTVHLEGARLVCAGTLSARGGAGGAAGGGAGGGGRVRLRHAEADLDACTLRVSRGGGACGTNNATDGTTTTLP